MSYAFNGSASKPRPARNRSEVVANWLHICSVASAFVFVTAVICLF